MTLPQTHGNMKHCKTTNCLQRFISHPLDLAPQYTAGNAIWANGLIADIWNALRDVAALVPSKMETDTRRRGRFCRRLIRLHKPEQRLSAQLDRLAARHLSGNLCGGQRIPHWNAPGVYHGATMSFPATKFSGPRRCTSPTTDDTVQIGEC